MQTRRRGDKERGRCSGGFAATRSPCLLVSPQPCKRLSHSFGSTNMPSHVDDLILSQLADGELPHDETVGALLVVLQDEESRSRLRQHLQLRQMSAAWRAQKPSANLIPAVPAAVPMPLRPAANGFPRSRNLQSSSIMVASVMGGLLVLLGVWVGKSSHGPAT